MSRISPLELLLPSGKARSVRRFGNADVLDVRETDADDSADIVVLAPDVTECSEVSRLRHHVGASVDSLAPEGLLFAAVPARYRLRVARLLAGRGLVRIGVVAFLPGFGDARYLLRLDDVAAHRALSDHVALWPKRQRLLGLVLRMPGGTFGATFLVPSVALLYGSSHRIRLFDWLHATVAKNRDDVATGLVHVSPTLDRAVLHVRDVESGRPFTVVKAALSPTVDLTREREALARLGPDARDAGVEVPQAAVLRGKVPLPVLALTPLQGRAAPLVLASDPSQLTPVLERVIAWLSAWNARTADFDEVAADSLERAVLKPLAKLEPQLGDEAQAYQDWLVRRCECVSGSRAPRPAAHNDLTMWNILVNGSRPLGIVDWEVAQPRSLPFTDFVYAVVDAVAASDGYRDRVSALRACFSAGGAHAVLVERLRTRFFPGFVASPELLDLCFHGCWLGHAFNEQRGLDDGHASEFLRVLRFVVRHRSEVTLGGRGA